MTCPHCGYSLDAFDKICPRCGKAPNAPVEPKAPTPPPTPQPPLKAGPPVGMPYQAAPVGGPVPMAVGNENTGLSVASMVLGIIGLVCICVSYVSLPAAILAVILGGVAIAKNHGGKGMAIAGVVTGSITLVLSLFVVASLLTIVGLTAKGKQIADDMAKATPFPTSATPIAPTPLFPSPN